MSYHVYLVRNETRGKAAQQGNPPDFFEHKENLEPFTKAQIKELTAKLELVGFERTRAKGDDLHFENEALGASATISKGALFFSAGGGESVFEIQMFASEWAGDEQFAKFDPQAGEWE